jgi:hypothetical protein
MHSSTGTSVEVAEDHVGAAAQAEVGQFAQTFARRFVSSQMTLTPARSSAST